MMATRGLPLGVEFSGGTIVIAQFESAVSEDQIRTAIQSIPGDEVVQQYGDPAANQWLIRLPQPERSSRARICPRVRPR